MLLYDNGANIDWFYGGTQTYDEMRADPLHRRVTEVPCVLYDNGAGKVYSYETLESLAARWAVPYTGDAHGTFDAIASRMDGTYRAEGVAEVESQLDALTSAFDTEEATDGN